MVIQHNMGSANTARMLGAATGSLAKSSEKLSSGYKINRSADDAAGLSISEKMRRQIRGLTQASNNAQDGISLCQIADGGLEESTQLVQRIRELSIQAANGTQSLSDRQSIQEEINQLISEVDKISATTQFNTINLLDGTLGQQLSLPKGDFNGKSLPVHKSLNNHLGGINLKIALPVIAPSASSAFGEDVMQTLQYELYDSIVPQCVLGISNALPTLKDAINQGMVSNQIGLKLYNDTKDNALASVMYGYYGSPGDKISALTLSLNVNTATLKFDTSGNLTADSRSELEATIIHEMMHAFSVDLLTNGMVPSRDNVIYKDGTQTFPIWFTEGLAQTASGGMDWVSSLGITPASSTAQISSILRSSANTIEDGGIVKNPGSQYATGYLAAMYLGYLAGGKKMTASAISSGLDKILKDIIGGYSLDSTIKRNTPYSGLKNFQQQFAVDSDSLNFVSNLSKTTGYYYDTGSNGGKRGALVGGDLTAKDLVKDTSAASPAYTPDYRDEEVLSNPVYRNTNSGGGVGNDSSSPGTGPIKDPNPFYSNTPIPAPPKNNNPNPPGPGPNPPGPGPNPPGPGTGAGSGRGLGSIKLQVGADAGVQIAFSIDEMSAKALGISGLSVLSVEGSLHSMDACDYALKKITGTRAKIGAVVNRLEHTVKNLDNVVENTTAAESLIRDTDMAREMVTYSRYKVLQSAGMSMLAQANQSNDGVLSLLS